MSTCIQNSSSVITCAVQELDKFIFTQSVGVFVSHRPIRKHLPAQVATYPSEVTWCSVFVVILYNLHNFAGGGHFCGVCVPHDESLRSQH